MLTFKASPTLIHVQRVNRAGKSPPSVTCLLYTSSGYTPVIYAQDLYGGGAKLSTEMFLGENNLKIGDRITNFYCMMGEPSMGIPTVYQMCIRDRLEAALETKYIRAEDLDTLKEWRKDPANWTPNNNQ